jgi:uncharacterized protein YggE
MRIRIFLALGIALILATASLAGCSRTTGAATTDGQPIINVNNQQGIWVNGEGKVTVTPDIATVSLGISAQAAKVADAQTQAAAAMDKVMKALTDSGIDQKDIQTQFFNISPQYRYDNVSQQSSIIGYQVSNIVTVKIRTVSKTGSIIDSVAAAGGDNTLINGVSFSVDQPGQYYSQARTLAMNDAKAKAQSLAGLAGVNLGKTIYITETSSSPPIPYAPAARDVATAAAPTTAISPGQTDITLNLQVAYAIQ